MAADNSQMMCPKMSPSPISTRGAHCLLFMALESSETPLCFSMFHAPQSRFSVRSDGCVYLPTDPRLQLHAVYHHIPLSVLARSGV